MKPIHTLLLLTSALLFTPVAEGGRRRQPSLRQQVREAYLRWEAMVFGPEPVTGPHGPTLRPLAPTGERPAVPPLVAPTPKRRVGAHDAAREAAPLALEPGALWKVVSLGLQKHGNSRNEYEDAHLAAPERARFAISDGATDSSYASWWADQLVKGYTEAPPAANQPEGTAGWLAPHQASWNARVQQRLAQPGVPWFAAERAAGGSFAALLGLEFQAPRPGGGVPWRALAVGDSMLFTLRDGQLLTSFPLERAEQFDNGPVLISTRADRHRAEAWRWLGGTAKPGDRFFLATDALGQWVLRRHEAGEDPFLELWGLESEQALTQLVERERTAGRMRNDDVTLLRLQVPTLEELAGAPLR